MALAALISFGQAAIHRDLIGLKAQYFDNPRFAPPMEVSSEFNSETFTRLDDRVAFLAQGYSAQKRAFPLYFKNDLKKRKWSSERSEDFDLTGFSAIWTGSIHIPEPDTPCRIWLEAQGGSAEMEWDGKKGLGTGQTLQEGLYPLKLDFSHSGNNAPALTLLWNCRGHTEPVPAWNLSPSPVSPDAADQFRSLFFGSVGLWFLGFFLLLWHCFHWRKRNAPFYFLLMGSAWFLLGLSKLLKKSLPFGTQILTAGEDWKTYEGFSRAILIDGDWLSRFEEQGIFYNLGYRYILTLVHVLTGEAPADAIVVQIYLLSLIISMLAIAISRLYGRNTGLIFMAIVLVSGQFLGFAQYLLDTIWTLGFAALGLGGLMAYRRAPSMTLVLVSAISISGIIFLRANLLPFLVVSGVWIFLFGPDERGVKKRLIATLVFLSIAAAPLSALPLRSLIVNMPIQWMPGNGMDNLWLGNQPPGEEGPMYFVSKSLSQPEKVRRLLEYPFQHPVHFSLNLLKKAAFIFGADLRQGIHIKWEVLIPWILFATEIRRCLKNKSRIHREDGLLILGWISVVIIPLIVIFPWSYGWRLVGPAFIGVYLFASHALLRVITINNKPNRDAAV